MVTAPTSSSTTLNTGHRISSTIVVTMISGMINRLIMSKLCVYLVGCALMYFTLLTNFPPE